MLHYQLLWKIDTMICHKYAITNFFLFLINSKLTANDDVNNENLDLHGPASSMLTISTMGMVSQN